MDHARELQPDLGRPGHGASIEQWVHLCHEAGWPETVDEAVDEAVRPQECRQVKPSQQMPRADWRRMGAGDRGGSG